MAKDSPYSLQNTLGFVNDNFGVIFLCIVFFVMGFLAGSLWTERQGGLAGAGSALVADGGSAPTAPAGPTEETLSTMPDITADDHVRGASDPKIYLVEYSDFECPYCQRFHSTMQQVIDEYGDDVAWVYRHYPLSFHALAQESAETSECIAELAGEDAFWAYADEIFEQNGALGGTLNEDAVAAAVAASGANASAVANCVDSGEMTELVNEQFATGGTAGVTGTPGTIVLTADGQYDFISGAQPYAQVQQVIEQYL